MSSRSKNRKAIEASDPRILCAGIRPALFTFPHSGLKPVLKGRKSKLIKRDKAAGRLDALAMHVRLRR